MKKSIILFLCFSLPICFSSKLFSQSSEELDQVELLKQFVGSWKAEIGMDSIAVLTFTPQFDGLSVTQENKANGSTFISYKGVFGLYDDQEMIIAAFPAEDGTMIIDLGKFVTKNKYVMERHRGNITHAASLIEWEFSSPESFLVRAKWRGEGMTWPDDWGWELSFKKIE